MDTHDDVRPQGATDPLPGIERDERQKIVGRWVRCTFGERTMHSFPERALRVVEEAVELAQVCGVERRQAEALIAHVYDRPQGDLMNEIGGVGVTLLALCEAFGVSADWAERDELKRVLALPAERFRARQQKKREAGLAS